MPTYTYQCVKCGNKFEYFHSISATPKITCEKCKSRCEKLIGNGAGIIFKGSGFYETDYKRKGKNGVDTKSSSNTGGNGKSSADTKTTSTSEVSMKS
ncbi:MAG: zinc ribbon domain-containing protein [Candidatus Hydrogenedentes bacterium]|nr:zinc ribbon domain-containing protein [Candidatus Hydrogenedentota bacterium]